MPANLEAQQWPQDGKGQCSFQSQRKAMPKNVQTTAQLHSSNTREDSTHGHHQMVNTKIRLIMLFAAKDGEALYSQQNKTWS